MNTTNLQGIGAHQAKAAQQLQVGDVIVWNFGSTSEVLSVAATAKTVLVSLAGGYVRRFAASRMVAVR